MASRSRFTGRGPNDTPRPPTTPKHRTSARKQKSDGLYTKDAWFCNCEPRQKARRLPVKKEGPSKGKFFWTCPTRHCKFFQWDDVVTGRTGGVTVSSPEHVSTPRPSETTPTSNTGQTGNAGIAPSVQLPTPSTTKTKATSPRTKSICDFFPKSPKSGGRTLPESSHAGGEASTCRTLSNHSSSTDVSAETHSTGPKRKRVEFEEDLLGDVSSDEEKLMEDAIERSCRKLDHHAGVRRVDGLATPTAQRTTDDSTSGVSTPATVRTLFPEAKRQRTAPNQGGEETADASDVHNALHASSPPANTRQGANVDTTQEVLSLLKGQSIDPSVAALVRQALERQAAHTRAAIMGRDAVRAQLKTRDARIAHLQEHVAALENKNKAQRENITNMKAGLADLYSKN